MTIRSMTVNERIDECLSFAQQAESEEIAALWREMAAAYLRLAALADVTEGSGSSPSEASSAERADAPNIGR